MAESNEGASGAAAYSAPHMTADGRRERSASVIAEFTDAAYAAAESLLEKQKRQIADRSGGIAGALHRAADTLQASENKALAHYVNQAGDHVNDIARRVRERRWDEIVADTQDFARRQPIWFVLGAMATGFLVARLIWAPDVEVREGNSAGRQVSSGEAARTVTAAIASGSAGGVRPAAGYAAGSSGTIESQ